MILFERLYIIVALIEWGVFMLKKVIIVFLILGAFFNSLVGVYAEENMIVTEDSKIISDDVIDKLNAKDSDEVLKIYNVPITFAFAEYQDIDSILMSQEVLEEYYAVKTDDTYTYQIEEYGVFVPINLNNLSTQAMQMCETGEVTANIAADVIVYNTYYLSGESSHMGTAIYYKTNKGDYVYFNHSSIGEYLFPIEAFCAYQRAILDEASQYPDRVGSASYSQVWDLSPYDFKSDSFNLDAEIPNSESSTQGNMSDTPASVETWEPSEGNSIATDKQQSDENNSAKNENEDKNQNWLFATIGVCLLIAGIAGGIVCWHKRSK